MIDPKMKSIGRRAINTWTSTVEPLVQQMKTFYPDDQERENFARRVQEDMANSSYHLYVPMYESTRVSLTVESVLLAVNQRFQYCKFQVGNARPAVMYMTKCIAS
jgi:hypothetical protein